MTTDTEALQILATTEKNMEDAASLMAKATAEIHKLRADKEALTKALQRSADTFADFRKTMTLLGRGQVAHAATIAEEDSRTALATHGADL